MPRKYHRSPKTNKWAVCTAEVCPFGDISAALYAKVRSAPSRRDQPDAKRIPVHTVRGMGKIETLGIEGGFGIVPDGYSALYCSRCETYLPEGYFEAFAEHETRVAPCPNPECDRIGRSIGDYGVDVYPSELKYWDGAQVKADHWFHVTTKPNWLDDATVGRFDESEAELGAPVLVHLGSKAAALHRLRDLVFQQRRAQPDKAAETYYLYEVQLTPEAPVNPNVLEDVIDGWPEVVVSEPAAEDFEPGAPWQATARVLDWQIQQAYVADGASAYVNACEAPGTISLIANPTKLVQVAREEIPLP